MNEYDSQVAEGLLHQSGYEFVPDGFKRTGCNGSIEVKADIVLMNTCSVREHAEDRVFGRLGMLGKAKKDNPDLIVGLMGCMVEEHRESLFRRFPQLDLMVGTRNIKELPQMIDEVRRTRNQVAKIKQDGLSIEYTDQIRRQGVFHAWLPIMTGCNKVCTFCIVPITRGSEVSMPAREVYRETNRLVAEGVKWVTLLGQNVNSYRGEEPRAKAIDFPRLLEMLCQIEGLEKISFTTSHPQDATPALYEVIAANPKISRRFHLPLQSGSDRMLKRMKRLHTYSEFVEKIETMRQMIPDVSITTDIISGFSGETDEDHQATRRALEALRFDGAYVYKYSLRPGTPASKLPDDVPISIKEERNAELLERQKRITFENNQLSVGQTVEVFVEGTSPKNGSQVLGHTHQEKKVIFSGAAALLGTFQKVTLKELRHDSFVGEPAD